jgi:hypothetical protein
MLGTENVIGMADRDGQLEGMTVIHEQRSVGSAASAAAEEKGR